jgi:uncharacterized protein YecT (DUF1311 family)
MKFWVVILVLSLTACGISQTQLPLATETTISVSPTPQIIEVTRVIKVEQTVVVTTTPIPLLAQECLNSAVTQLDLNGCAISERELAKTELEKTIAQIKFTSEEKRLFEQLQEKWQIQVEADCDFLYGQILTDDKGNLRYKGGSMAPMQRAFCEAGKYKQRIEDLKFAYLTPNG